MWYFDTIIDVLITNKESTVYNLPLVPEDFGIPEILETERMRLRPLTINDAVKDYEAVMTSEERLRTVFDPGGDWRRD